MTTHHADGPLPPLLHDLLGVPHLAPAGGPRALTPALHSQLGPAPAVPRTLGHGQGRGRVRGRGLGGGADAGGGVVHS